MIVTQTINVHENAVRTNLDSLFSVVRVNDFDIRIKELPNS